MRRATAIASRITLRFGFGNWRTRCPGVKKRRIQRRRHVIRFVVIREAGNQQLIAEALRVILAAKQHKYPPYFRIWVDNDLTSRRNRMHHLPVKLAAIAIHAGVHPVQHFHSYQGPAWQDVHFVWIRRIQAGLQIKCQHRSRSRMNRFDTRFSPLRYSSEHTHKAQKYRAETMHGLGPFFFKNSFTTKTSLDLRGNAVNAISSPRHAIINLDAEKHSRATRHDHVIFIFSGQLAARLRHPPSLLALSSFCEGCSFLCVLRVKSFSFRRPISPTPQSC